MSESVSSPLLRQLCSMKRVSSMYPIHFKTPAVVALFAMENVRECSKNRPVLDAISELDGVGIELVDTLSPPIYRPPTPLSSLYSGTLLLDVTTLIALCSDLCQADTFPEYTYFNNEPLQLQLQDENRIKLLPSVLGPLFAGRRLITTRSAADKLLFIASTIAGPRESDRVASLFTRVEKEVPQIDVVADSVSPRFKGELAKRIGDLNTAVFGTGDEMRATVVSANKVVAGFLEREIGASVVVHNPRAFVEKRPKDIPIT